MTTAFQVNAFQNNAFQISGSGPPPDTHDGADADIYRRHYERLRRNARASEQAIYRNVPRPSAKKIAADMREHLLPSKFSVPVSEIVYPVPYEINRMPLADPMQWLLDDDEEAIQWLM